MLLSFQLLHFPACSFHFIVKSPGTGMSFSTFYRVSIILIDVSRVNQFVKPEPVLNYLSLDRHFLLIREEYDTAKEELGVIVLIPTKHWTR